MKPSIFKKDNYSTLLKESYREINSEELEKNLIEKVFAYKEKKNKYTNKEILEKTLKPK